MKVLIAFDGSLRSQAALEDLARAGLPASGVEAEVVRVAEIWIPPDDAYTGPSLWEAAMRDVAAHGRDTVASAARDAETAAVRLRQIFPAWRVGARVETGPAALRLIERAERWPAELLVVGAQGHAVAERLGVGSVALRVLTHLRCHVRVARPAGDAADRLRILVGVDGSPDAAAAVEAVAARTWPAGTEARVVTVVDHRVLAAPAGADLPPGAPPSAVSEAVANAAAERLRGAGLAALASVIHGDPKRVLAQAAWDWDANSIFLGARGLTAVRRFLLGSVSTSVAMHAPCSVEVVHHKDQSVE
jgi:nucleotide-binding universal stress UspA family protein